ncbi:MAG: hypothetical protein K5829_11710 [Treponema sp.]|nr:hypothetical protein [Treponema sp.]
MKVNRLVERVLENWPIKIFCLVAATLLYLFNRISTVEKKSFVVPVQVVQEGSVMQVGALRKNVNVLVRLAHDDTSSIHSNQIQASVNLNSFTESGTYTVPVNIELDDSLLQIDPLEIKVNPEYLEVKVEKKDFKFVPIEISFVGEPEHGYFVSESFVTPSSVEIIGPEASVLATEKLSTERIDLNGLRRSFETPTKLRNINNMIKVSEGSECSVSVKIEAIPMEKTIDGLPLVFTNLNPSLELVSPVPRVSFRLKGVVPTLENYTPAANAVQADLSKIVDAGSYDIPLRFIIPNSFSVIEKSISSVNVKVIRKPELIEEENKIDGEEDSKTDTNNDSKTDKKEEPSKVE